MKKLYSVLLVSIMIVFGGCAGASSENPTITLQGQTNITSTLGEIVYEAGFSANDVKDGDLSSAVVVDTNLNVNVAGTYYVTYTVVDSDGYRAQASRTITVVDNDDGFDGGVTYDLADYNFNYFVYIDGKIVMQNVYDYDSEGTYLTEVVFEQNPENGAIHEFHDNEIDNTSYIQLENIRQVYSDSTFVDLKRELKIGDFIADETLNSVDTNCRLVEHLGSINTQLITGVNILDFDYQDVLHIECTASNGLLMDSYLANGWGEVLTVTALNNQTEYTVLDKNSMQPINP